jgi:hypothetical protein
MAKTKQQKKTKISAAVESKVVHQERHEVVRSRIDEIVSSTEVAFLDLAELLYEARANDFVELWGFDNFKDYAASLAIGQRKAYYLLEIWEAVLRCGDKLDMSELRRIGWTKVKEIAQFLDRDTCSEWIQTAGPLSTKELVELVRSERREASGESDKPVGTKITLLFRDPHSGAFMQALAKAKEMLDTEQDDEALAHVCLDWLESGGTRVGTLPDIIRQVEQQFNVKLLVVEDGSEGVEEEDSDDLEIDDLVE